MASSFFAGSFIIYDQRKDIRQLILDGAF